MIQWCDLLRLPIYGEQSEYGHGRLIAKGEPKQRPMLSKPQLKKSPFPPTDSGHKSAALSISKKMGTTALKNIPTLSTREDGPRWSQHITQRNRIARRNT